MEEIRLMKRVDISETQHRWDKIAEFKSNGLQNLLDLVEEKYSDEPYMFEAWQSENDGEYYYFVNVEELLHDRDVNKEIFHDLSAY